MKILITGGFGYLGGRLANFLSSKKVDIYLGSRYLKSNPSWCPQAKTIKIDWNKEESIDEAVNNIDVIIHMAALNAEECSENEDLAYQVNVLNTKKIIDSAIRKNVSKIIYLSTIHVYGSPLKGNLSEEIDVNPEHPYAKTHLQAEKILLNAFKKNQIDLNIIRLSNAFGPPVEKDANCWMLVFNDFCLQALNTKKIIIKSLINVKRDFVPISYVNSSIFHFINKAMNKSSNNVLYNIGGKYNISILDAANIIKSRIFLKTGNEIEIIFNQDIKDNVHDFSFNINKILKSGLNNVEKIDINFEIDSLIDFCLINMAK
tara:strand:- start:12394 stop:13344 length:951 start_codon:yes stop_codon:yes gene_type:complete